MRPAYPLAIAILCAVLPLATVQKIAAHDLVLIPAGPNTLTLKFGHPQEYEAPNREKLIKLDLYLAGDEPPVSILSGVTKSTADYPTIDLRTFAGRGNAAIVSGEYDNGYFVSVSSDKYFNTSKLHFPAAKDSSYNFKFGKTLFPAASAGGFDRRLDEQLEIVPVTDPFKVRPGQQLPVEVLYQGKALAGIGVEVGDGKTKIKEEDIPRYKTNDAGIAQVPIAKPGLQIIAVDYQTSPRFPALCDHDDYSADLTFIVGDAR